MQCHPSTEAKRATLKEERLYGAGACASVKGLGEMNE